MLNTNTDYLKTLNELTALNVAQIEKLAELQVEAFEEISNAGVVSLKKAADVATLDGAKAYIEEQSAALRILGENAASRSKTAVEISKDYPNQVKAIFEKAVA